MTVCIVCIVCMEGMEYTSYRFICRLVLFRFCMNG